jgi:hypothetical protein
MQDKEVEIQQRKALVALLESKVRELQVWSGTPILEVLVRCLRQPPLRRGQPGGARLPPDSRVAPVCPQRHARKNGLCTFLVSRSLLRCLWQRTSSRAGTHVTPGANVQGSMFVPAPPAWA